MSLIPNHQAEDELVSSYGRHGKPSATLRRANWLRHLLETSKPAKISLFLLTILAIAMVISDAVLTPPISGAASKIHFFLIFFLKKMMISFFSEKKNH